MCRQTRSSAKCFLALLLSFAIQTTPAERSSTACLLRIRGGMPAVGSYFDNAHLAPARHLPPKYRTAASSDPSDGEASWETQESLLRAARAELEACHQKLSAMKLVSTTFTYRPHKCAINICAPVTGRKDRVFLVGAWSQWLETYEMRPQPDGSYAVEVPVPPGTAYFKFIVNDVWTRSCGYGISGDGNAFENNFLPVRPSTRVQEGRKHLQPEEQRQRQRKAGTHEEFADDGERKGHAAAEERWRYEEEQARSAKEKGRHDDADHIEQRKVLEGSGDQTMKLAHKHLEAGNLVDARESCAWAQAEWENAGVDRSQELHEFACRFQEVEEKLMREAEELQREEEEWRHLEDDTEEAVDSLAGRRCARVETGRVWEDEFDEMLLAVGSWDDDVGGRGEGGGWRGGREGSSEVAFSSVSPPRSGSSMSRQEEQEKMKDYLDTVQRIRDKRQELEHAQQLLIELQRMQTMQEEGHAIPASAPGEPALGYEHGGHTEILRDSTQHDGETVGAASQESCKTCGGAHRYCLGTSYTVSPTKGGATPAHDVLELHQEHSSISSSPGAKSFGVKDKKVQEARSRASALSHESAASDGLADPVVLFSRGLRVPGVFSSQFVDVRSSGSAARGPKTDMHPGGDCNTRGNVYEQSAVGATYLWLGHWTYFQTMAEFLGDRLYTCLSPVKRCLPVTPSKD